jgi:chromosome segregation ATPase
MDILQEKFNKQLLLWDAKITESITTAVNAVLSTEMAKFSTMLHEINNNIVKLNSDNAHINKTLSENTKKLDEIEKSINFMSERQDTFDYRMKIVEERISCLDDLGGKISSLEYKISIMDQQARQCNIEVSNMPERRNENLVSIVELLGDVLKCPIRSADIIAVHRVPHADQRNSRPKNIIVKFSSRIQRDNILAAYRANKGLDSSKL